MKKLKILFKNKEKKWKKRLRERIEKRANQKVPRKVLSQMHAALPKESPKESVEIPSATHTKIGVPLEKIHPDPERIERVWKV